MDHIADIQRRPGIPIGVLLAKLVTAGQEGVVDLL